MNYIDILSSKEDLVSPGISTCEGCAAELVLRTVLKVLGKNTVVGIPPGCMAGSGCVGWNYDSGLKIPVHIPLLGNTAAFLTGVKAMYNKTNRDINVLAFAGDGASSDCGFQSLSGSAERGDNIIYLCYDNEGYMNTGFQRSGTTSKNSYTSTTPVGSDSRGKQQHKKDMPMIMAMHGAAYVATLSPAYMKDFVRKIEKAASIKEGFVYLHVFSPCPTGWKSDPKESISIARKAVQTNFFPLFEVEDMKFTLNMEIKKPEPISEFINMLGKFEHINDEEVHGMQTMVDNKYNQLLALVNNN